MNDKPIEDFSRYEYHYEIGVDLDNVDLQPVNTITKEPYKGKVYDLKIKDTHNYIAKDLGVVHNGGGKRKGSFAAYLEPWHSDIFTFLDIRKNHGKEELRARDLFPALWIPDLFMEQVSNGGDWCLTCPNEQLKHGFTRLDELHSEAFNNEYKIIFNAVKNGDMPGKIIPAQEVWASILESQIETGTPFMLYKDAANSKSNQQNLGTIKSSNLCTEIIEYSSPTEQAVCNLASINLTKIFKIDKFTNHVDYDRLGEVTRKIVRNINTVIDRSSYPTQETMASNLNHRPMGIGVQGLADLFALLRYPFTSAEAKQINKNIFEVIYYNALVSSVEEAKKYGKYSSFDGSPASKGILQFDMWGVTPEYISLDKWDALKEDIKTYGLRNSLFLAPMPTASTAQIMGNNEAFEPFKNNMYVRRVLSGEFSVLNKYLVKELENLNLWDSNMKLKLVDSGGSIQHIDNIPQEIKDLFPTIWETSMRDIIDMAADRGAYIDQSQSMNIWVDEPNFGILSTIHMHGWKKGLKTGMYYLRSKPAADALKTLAISQIENDQPQVTAETSEFECEGCGS